MLENGMHKSWKMQQNGARMGAEIEKILIKMKVKTYMDFLSNARAEDGDPGTAGILGGPF